MAAIKHTLQREVFLPAEERLIAVVYVTKVGKKKKGSFLCAAVTTEKPIQAQICQVKKSDRGDSYKKKASWQLRELKLLDAKCTGSKESAEFDIQLDKTYKWISSNLHERNAFIQCLYKLSQRYLVQKPKFINIPSGILDDESQGSEVERSVQQAEELASATEWEYQALTGKEEEDLNKLMKEVDNAIGNAEAFAEQLSKDLSVLDGANVHSIMGSEDQVLELMVLIDQGLQEAVKVEERLDEYEEKLESVKDLMEVMKDKDSMIQTRNTNHQKLLESLDGMVSNLDLDHKHMRALLDGDLSTGRGIKECTEASKALLRCMSAEIHPSMKQIAAVQEQQKRFTKLKTTFSKRLAHHLNNLFIHQGNELGENMGRCQGELKLVSHKASHKDLLPYADMMYWMKQCDTISFSKLTKVYTQSISKLYDREVKEFVETAKQKLGYIKSDKRDATNWFVPSVVDKKAHSGSSSSLNKPLGDKGRSASVSTLESDRASLQGSELDVTGRGKFDQMLEVVLNELSPVCNAEQEFCVTFFHLATTVEEEPDQPQEERSPAPAEFKQKRIHEELRKMMSELFPSLEGELCEFINTGHKMDSFNSLYMLVRMSQQLMSSADTNSFLIKVLGTCLVHVRRNFNTFIERQIQIIRECKPFKKSKIGVIPFVHQFQEFAEHAEIIFRGSERRTELDKAYAELLTAIFQEIARISTESPKIPPEVIMFENYHHMHAVLSQLKIAVLEAQKKEAKQLYLDNQQRYVTIQLGRPMEKLNVFFEGIQARVAAGVKEKEVGYQLAFSKQELRKVIKEYPGKEVKKGLEHLYKRIEKHLSEEENLLQVVWHSVQDEFLKQYKNFDSLISKCYPGSGITLEFTINDVLLYFSDIAQSH